MKLKLHRDSPKSTSTSVKKSWISINPVKMKNEGKQNTICNKLWIFHNAFSFSLRGVWFAADGAVRVRPRCAWWCVGREPVGFWGQRLVLNLDFPLQRSQMDLLRLGQQPGASVVLGMGKTLSFQRGDKMSLSCPSLDPELELTFLPFKDFSAPLFCSIIKRH